MGPQLDSTSAALDARFAAATTNQLGLALLRHVTPTDANVVLSPVSLQIVLSLILLGSDTGSNTELELLGLLGYDKLAPSTPQNSAGASGGRLAGPEALRRAVGRLGEATAGAPADVLNFYLANLVLTNADRAKLNASYSAEMKRLFANTNFEEFAGSAVGQPLADRINGWVANITHKQITKLVEAPHLDAQMALVLLNAAHFKGKWLNQFAAEQTRAGPFHCLGGKQTKVVKFMHQEGSFALADLSAGQDEGPEDSDLRGPELEHLRLAAKLDCRAIALPFSLDKGDELDMIFVLPNRRDGLASLLAGLTAESLSVIFQELEYKAQLEVSLPRFEFESSHDTKKILKSMGVSRLFSCEAELGAMLVKSPEISISQLLHKAKITVDENGAEAAAATAAVASFRALTWPTPRPFVADRPFLFLIRHKPTSLVLFLGQVSKL